MTKMAGGRIPAATPEAWSRAIVLTTTRCPAVEPCDTSAAGVVGGMPAAWSFSATSGRLETPM